MSFIIPGSSGAVPGSPVNSVQYNSAGVFAGNALFKYENGPVFEGLLTVPAMLEGANTFLTIQPKTPTTLGGGGQLHLRTPQGFSTDESFSITIGTGSSSLGKSGDLTISAGDGATFGGSVLIGAGYASNAGSTGGNVTIASPLSFGGGSNGFVSITAGFGSSAIKVQAKIGTTSTTEIGIFNVTPVIRQTNAIAGSVFVAGVGVAVQDVSTFDGYTIAQLVKAMRNYGWLT